MKKQTGIGRTTPRGIGGDNVDDFENKRKWLLDQGYRHDPQNDCYIIQIRIFDYGAQNVFTAHQFAWYTLDDIKEMHKGFTKRALNREQF